MAQETDIETRFLELRRENEKQVCAYVKMRNLARELAGTPEQREKVEAIETELIGNNRLGLGVKQISAETIL